MNRKCPPCLGVAAQSPGECEKGQPFFFDKGVLMRRWVCQPGGAEDSSIEDWGRVVIPFGGRQHVLEVAHEHPMVWSPGDYKNVQIAYLNIFSCQV